MLRLECTSYIQTITQTPAPFQVLLPALVMINVHLLRYMHKSCLFLNWNCSIVYHTQKNSVLNWVLCYQLPFYYTFILPRSRNSWPVPYMCFYWNVIQEWFRARNCGFSAHFCEIPQITGSVWRSATLRVTIAAIMYNRHRRRNAVQESSTCFTGLSQSTHSRTRKSCDFWLRWPLHYAIT